jgi:hypothetical protein
MFVIYGGGRHVYYLEQSPDRLSRTMMWWFYYQPFSSWAVVFGQISIAILTLRMIGGAIDRRKWILGIVFAIYVSISVVDDVLKFVQCSPTHSLWDQVTNDSCWDADIAIYVAVSQSGMLMTVPYSSKLSSKWLGCVLTDGEAVATVCLFLLVGIATSVVWQMQMVARMRLELTILLSLGAL